MQLHLTSLEAVAITVLYSYIIAYKTERRTKYETNVERLQLQPKLNFTAAGYDSIV
jgi:hypothetical protein